MFRELKESMVRETRAYDDNVASNKEYQQKK